MTDEQPDQPRPDLPPTLPLPTEPLAAFGARARAEMPGAAQVPAAAPPSEPPALPTMPVVYVATPPAPPADPTQPFPAAPAVGSAQVPAPPAPSAPAVGSAQVSTPPVAPAVGSAQVPAPTIPSAVAPLAPTAPISSAPAVGSAQVSSPPVTPPLAPTAPISSAPAVGSAQVSTPPVASAAPAPPVAPPPVARATQPAPPRLQLPSEPAPATRPQATPPGRPAGGPGPVLVQLGEVSVSSTTIHTPSGEIPLRGSQWTVSDQWHSQQRIPAWAVVCAVVGFFLVCFLSLLFLLAKETRYSGTVQVLITNGPRQYVIRIPVTDQRVVAHIHAQVNYARSLAAL
ncbi:hypothetical protein [Catellatospora coxensis]|uniref:hypothetical protein n=1 Tax=Catellatospora coxensis TaxID=310354 RepID=UPI0031DF51BD